MTAIVTDVHYRMSVALIRDLSARGVRVVACEKASLQNPVGFASSGAAQCVTLPEEDYADALYELCRDHLAREGEKPALLPVGAKTLAMLSENAGRFSAVCGLCIASPAQLALFNDKSAVAALAKSLHVPVPASFLRSAEEPEAAFFSRVPLPCVVKPICGEQFGLSASQRYRICRTESDLQAAYAHFSSLTGQPPVVQEYLPGAAYGCCANIRSPAAHRAAARAKITRSFYPAPRHWSARPASPALPCSSSNAAQTARRVSWR